VSGIVRRCDACGADIVIRRRHRATSIPCPSCGAAHDVPANLDFITVDVATAWDQYRTEFQAFLLFLSLFGCCFPLSAWVWWNASGAIGRARDEDRIVHPSLIALRRWAIGVTLVEAVLALPWWASLLR
jgi:hypothetical protein